MSQLSVSIPAHQLAELEALGSGESMRRALYQAYKRTAREIRVNTQTIIKSRSSLATKRIREAMKDGVDFAMTMQQRGRMTITHKGIPLADYKPKVSKSSGIRVKLPKGELTLRHAFNAKMPNGLTFVVVRGKKLPVTSVNARKLRFKKGRSLPDFMNLAYWNNGDKKGMAKRVWGKVDSGFGSEQWRKGKGFTPRGFVQKLKVDTLAGPSVLTTIGQNELTEIGREAMRDAQQIFEKNVASQILRFQSASASERSRASFASDN